MLDITMATDFVPGTNVKGRVAGANWSFLLPRFDLDRVVCYGMPSAAACATLARLGCEVVVVGGPGGALVDGVAGGVRWVFAATSAAVLSGSVDLVVLTDARMVSEVAVLAEAARVLREDGWLYVEPSRADVGFVGSVPGFASAQVFWLTPRRGEMHTAVLLHDRVTIDYFFRHALVSPSIRVRGFARVEQFLARRRWVDRLTRRYGVLVGRSASVLADGPPRYLCSVAQAAGLDFGQYRWGLVARGDFSSRKVLFFLLNRASGVAEYVVKMTRDPALNPRLENECRALTDLWDRGLGTADSLPRVVCFGHHGGLAIVGESVVEGEPFRQRTQATARCPYARAAVDWLVDLGAATADREGDAVQVAGVLSSLFERFLRVYAFAPEHAAFLGRQIALLGASKVSFPLVFQHGDPGVWNVLVGSRGQVAFLDWEAAEARGMPLWDVFYFLRSFGVGVSRSRGVRDALVSFQQHYLVGSPIGGMLVDVTARYCARCGLSPELVEPLFYTCWMHRALKEATRLSRERLERGHYVSLLRLCIEQRSAPGLRRLFGVVPS